LLHEIRGSDFLAFLDTNPDTAEVMRNMCWKRLFKKAVKAHSIEKNRGVATEDLVRAFKELDLDDSGTISLDELRNLMNRMDPTISEKEIVELMKSIDIDEDGQLDFENFKRLFRSFELAVHGVPTMNQADE